MKNTPRKKAAVITRSLGIALLAMTLASGPAAAAERATAESTEAQPVEKTESTEAQPEPVSKTESVEQQESVSRSETAEAQPVSKSETAEAQPATKTEQAAPTKSETLESRTKTEVAEGGIKESYEGGSGPIVEPTAYGATSDNATTAMNQPVVVKWLANDKLPEDYSVIFNYEGSGKLVDNKDGSVTFTPGPGFVGTDKAWYSACWTEGKTRTCSEVGIYITVERPAPQATDDSAETAAGTPVRIAIHDNDMSSPDDYLRTISLPENGSIVANEDGTITYKPNPGFAGEDVFKYRLCTAPTKAEAKTKEETTISQCASAVVTVNVLPEPKPVAVDDEATTMASEPVVIDWIANDTTDDTTFLSTVKEPENGTLEKNEDGTFTYTPADGFTGTDEFAYQICNKSATAPCETATVTVTVVAPVVEPEPEPELEVDLEPKTDLDPDPVTPTVTPDVEDTMAGQPVNIDWLANDELPTGFALQSVTTTSENGGTIVDNGDGTFTYTPAAGFSGADQFSYVVCGPDNECYTASVSVEVMGATQDRAPVVANQASLPVTGSETSSLASAGLAMMAAGGVLLASRSTSRRRLAVPNRA